MQSTNGTVQISQPLDDVIKQLNEPQTAAAIKNLAKNAQLLDALVSGLDGFLRRSDEIVENVGTSFREFAPQSNDNGANFIEEMPELLSNLPSLAKTGNKLSKIADTKEFDAVLTKENLVFLKNWIDQLNDPATNNALQELIKNAPTLAFLVTALNTFIGRSEEIVDNVATSLQEFAPQVSMENQAVFGQLISQVPKVLPALAENLPPLVDQLPSLMKTGAKLGEIAESEGVQAFLNSNMLSPELVNFLGEAGKTAVKAQIEFQENPKQLGIYGLYKETKDEDVQRGLGFLITLAKNFGQMLKK